MSDSGVEFFEAAADAARTQAPPPDSPAAPRPLELRLVLATAFWTVAAALTVLAPFTTVYAVRYRRTSDRDQAVDGWGRLDLTVPLSGGDVHAPRYGVVFVVAAVLLAGLAALASVELVAQRRRHRLAGPRVHTAARAASVAVPSLLVGVAGAVGLEVMAVADEVRATAEMLVSVGATGPGGRAVGTPRLHVGPLLWVSLAAVVAAAVGAWLFWLHRAALDERSRAESAPVAEVDAQDGDGPDRRPEGAVALAEQRLAPGHESLVRAGVPPVPRS